MVSASRTIEVDAKGSDTVGAIKRKIEQQEGVSAGSQHLIFAGKKLDDRHTADDYNLERLSRPIYLVIPDAGQAAPQRPPQPQRPQQPPTPHSAARPQGPILLGPWSPQGAAARKQESGRHANVEETAAPTPGCRMFEISFPELYRLSRQVSAQLGLGN